MITIEHIPEMRSWSEAERRVGRRIVLVPTMGFLHEGHLSLARRGRDRADRIVVSLFVNAMQFGPGEDFLAYPRDLERDRALLEKEGVDVLFHPLAEEMYPEHFQTYVEVERLSSHLCGVLRPGHFRGVATVVLKLLNIIRPHAAIFGLKDYQQLRIIRRMVEDLHLDVEIVEHPIVRETDGLAMSSRNAYLNEKERKAATSLYRALKKAEALVLKGERGVEQILVAVKTEIQNEPLARLEYAELRDPEDLEKITRIEGRALLALAVKIGRTRLIDNTVLKR